MGIEVKGYNGSVAFDGQFVTIIRKGALARMTVGKGEKRIPLASITAVQWKPAGAMVNGFIQFTVPGGNEKKSAFGSQTRGAVNDENSVVFVKKQMPDFEELRMQVEMAIARRGSGQPAAPAPQPNIAEQIQQLAGLRDQGLLTNEEFACRAVASTRQSGYAAMMRLASATKSLA
jgi:hypothetical protein